MSTPIMRRPGDIAKTILLRATLRAKVIAETYLSDPVRSSTVRNMFDIQVPTRKTRPVMGTGMGSLPSASIPTS